MKLRSSKLLSLLLALVLVLGCVTPALALEELAYTGDGVNFVNKTGSQFGMFTPQDGTLYVVSDDTVVIHFVPKNTTVYNGLHWGAIDDAELTKDVAFRSDGAFDLTVSTSKCGKMIPVAPLKPDGATTGKQYYLAIPALEKIPQALPYSGDAVDSLDKDGKQFGMFTPQDGTTAYIVDDDVVIHFVPKNKTVYNAMHMGLITQPLTKDVTFNADGSFDLKVSKAMCGLMIPIAPIKASDATATTSKQYYLAIPAADKLPGGSTEPSEPGGDTPGGGGGAGAGGIELTVTNNTGMFKAECASYADGTLYFTLSGKGYHYLYKGTYAQAVANGDQTANWIAGKENTEGKWEFAVPVAEGETYIPVVAISQSYYEKYQSGENPLARAFYPRQLELDLTAKTLVTGDYDNTATLSVTNNVSMFKVADTAGLRTVGGPNSNNYAVELQLTMGSTAYDKAFVGAKDAAAAADAVISIDDNNVFTLPVTGLTDAEFVASFHSASKDTWYERQFTIDAAKATLTIDPVKDSSGSDSGNNSGNNSGGNSGNSNTPSNTTVYPDGVYYNVPFSIERAAGGTWHNVAWPTCTVYVEGGALYIDFTMERVAKDRAPQYAWAKTSAGSVVPVIDEASFTCTFKRLPVPNLGRVEVSMMTTAMSEDQIVDYVMYIDDTAILSGGAGGGASGAGGTEGAAKTVKNADGSTTEITTNADGSTTAVTTYDDGRTVETDTAADGSVVEVKKDADGKITEASASISETALANAEKADKPVTLSREFSVAEDAAAAAPLTITLPKDAESVTVEIPVKDVSNTSVIVLVNADGSEEVLPRTALTEKGLMVTLTDSATVKIVDNAQSFSDMPADAEEAEAIQFVAARGLMNGVGGGLFAADIPMTRGMFTTVLYRMERKPDAPEGTDFADVAAGQWYSDAIAWATEAGIVQGYGESFGVNDEVTTEQIAVMLWRLAGEPAAEPVETGAHDWGAAAMSWAISVGLIGRESTGANASAPATRGWVSILVERFINLG